MKKLPIQEFLLSHSSYDQAIKVIRTEPYWVKVIEYKDRILLLYNMLSSPTNNEITNDCRGLILSKDFKTILSRPFKRFYNFKEKDAENQDFNFENALVQEKADGSLIQVYHDGQAWCVGTKGKAFAEGTVGLEAKETYLELFMRTAQFNNDVEFQKFFSSIAEDSKSYTWLFELIGPENRILTPYHQNSLRYLDKISKDAEEINPNIMNELERYKKDFLLLNSFSEQQRFSSLSSYIVTSFDELMEKMNDLNLLDEGFVCIENRTRRRIKIKQQSYMNCAKSVASPQIKLENAISLIFEHEQEEYLSIFPEQQPLFDYVGKKYAELIKNIEEDYNKYKYVEDRKVFAETIKHSPYKAFLFTKSSKKGLSFQEILNNLPLSSKVKVIGEVPFELYR